MAGNAQPPITQAPKEGCLAIRSTCELTGARSSTSPRTEVASTLAARAETDDSDSQLQATVQELAKRVAEDATHPKAEVLMPPERQLQVRLVKLDDVRQLQEARADEGIAAGAFWAMFGALLGIGVNLVTSGATSISLATRVAIISATLFLICAGLLWLRFSRRAKVAKRQLENDLTQG